MKKLVIHTIPVLVSFVWLIINHHSFNPISLKGPHFLTFYLILIFGFYASILILKVFREEISKTTYYFMISIFILGIIKLCRGIFLGKQIGYLVMILIIEIVVITSIEIFTEKNKA